MPCVVLFLYDRSKIECSRRRAYYVASCPSSLLNSLLLPASCPISGESSLRLSALCSITSTCKFNYSLTLISKGPFYGYYAVCLYVCVLFIGWRVCLSINRTNRMIKFRLKRWILKT